MSDNVVPFGKEPENEDREIIVCSTCSCVSFQVCSDGRLYCVGCKDYRDDDLTKVSWDEVEKFDELESTHIHRYTAFETEDLSYHRLVESIKDRATVAMLSVMFMNGMHRVWTIGYETPEQEEWFQTRVNEIMKLAK